jgi:uncharacterized protein DUF1326
MKRARVVAAILGLAVAPLFAGGGVVTGSYVEARTAEVFAGGCVMGSEAETMGRQAILAWNVDRGSFNGVSVAGLSVVAAVSGDRNLGIQEMGGDKPVVRSAVFVDERANPAQRLALVAMARELSNGIMGTIVNVTPSPIQFSDNGGEIEVEAGQVFLQVAKHIVHDPTCGAMQWFHPLASVDDPAIGLAAQHSFTGNGLGTKWSDPNKRSAFFGTFSR